MRLTSHYPKEVRPVHAVVRLRLTSSLTEQTFLWNVGALRRPRKKTNAIVKTIGKAGKYNLYQAILNPKASKTTCFIGAVHGNEVFGPYAILKFLEESKISKNRIILSGTP